MLKKIYLSCLFVSCLFLLPLKAEQTPEMLLETSKTNSVDSFAYCLGYYEGFSKDEKSSGIIRFLDGKSAVLGASEPFSKKLSFAEGKQDGKAIEASDKTKLFCLGVVQGTVSALQKNEVVLPQDAEVLDLPYCLGYYTEASNNGDTLITLFDKMAIQQNQPALSSTLRFKKGQAGSLIPKSSDVLLNCMDMLMQHMNQKGIDLGNYPEHPFSDTAKVVSSDSREI